MCATSAVWLLVMNLEIVKRPTIANVPEVIVGDKSSRISETDYNKMAKRKKGQFHKC